MIFYDKLISKLAINSHVYLWVKKGLINEDIKENT